MRYAGIFFIGIFGLLAAMVTGQQTKPNFSGKWQANAEKSQFHSGQASAVSLTIEQKDASIHVVKTSMTLDENAKTISATVTYISPQAEPDKLVLEKM